MTWQTVALVGAIVLVGGVIALGVWYRRSGRNREEAIAAMRALGLDLARLPRRLRRLAADPRTPRRARWLLIGLAVYVASPIDPIPDFLPLIGHLDEVIIVPIALRQARRMIPPEVWAEHFPPRSSGSS